MVGVPEHDTPTGQNVSSAKGDVPFPWILIVYRFWIKFGIIDVWW
jgi:hypothetical protein